MLSKVVEIWRGELKVVVVLKDESCDCRERIHCEEIEGRRDGEQRRREKNNDFIDYLRE